MNNIGFIGYGSMSRMLISSLIKYGNLDQSRFLVTRKNKDKLKEIKEDWAEINIAEDITEVVRNSHYIFICVKPLEFPEVLKEIRKTLLPDQHVISIAGSVHIKDMERVIDCKITKLLPTVITEVQGGVALVCHNSKVGEDDQKRLEELLTFCSRLRRIKEEDFGFASEFTSCGPGLYAAIFKEFVESGLRHGDSFSKEDINDLVLSTMVGTAKLMQKKKMDFSEVIERVATKGGITEEGVKILSAGLPKTFDEAFEGMLNKRELVGEKIHNEIKHLAL